MQQELREARTETRGAKEELRQVKQIANGKQYLLQSVFGGQRFKLLTPVWHSIGAIADHLKSVADTTRHYAAWEGDAELWTFWAQSQEPEHPP